MTPESLRREASTLVLAKPPKPYDMERLVRVACKRWEDAEKDRLVWMAQAELLNRENEGLALLVQSLRPDMFKAA